MTAPQPTGTSRTRREFLQLSGAALSALAIGCADDELVAGPILQDPPPIPVGPPDDLGDAQEVHAPTAFRAANGELLAYIGHDTIYFWPRGGTRPALRVLLTTDRSSWSGGHGLQLDRPRGVRGALETIYSEDGARKWETGLDAEEDASGQGIGPDFVLAYDNAHPPGDRLRMAPGGYLRHGPIVGTPNLNHRLHIQGGRADGGDNDRALNILYLQAGRREFPGAAQWLIRGEGYHPGAGSWGEIVYGVGVDGRVETTALHVTDRTSSRGPSWSFETTGALSGPTPGGLAISRGDVPLFHLSQDGRGLSDRGWFTFSPAPPLPAERMTAADWCDWAFEDAAKDVKPYDGLPSASHPHVRERAARTGRDPADIAEEEQRRYGKDISRIAIGAARWVRAVQDALEDADTFEDFRRSISRMT